MKKLIIILIVLAAALAAYFFSKDYHQASTTDVGESWATYSNEKHGYSIEYPSSWYFGNIRTDSDYAAVGVDGYNNLTAGDTYLTPQDPARSNTNNLPANNFEIFYRLYKVDRTTTFAKFFTDNKISTEGANAEELTIASLPAYRMTFVTLDSNTNKNITTVETFVKDEDRIFMFTYSGQPISDEHKTIAERVINSLKIQ